MRKISSKQTSSTLACATLKNLNNQIDLLPAKTALITLEEVAVLRYNLRGLGWLLGSEISFKLLAVGLLWSDRKIRAVAAASEGQIISGQRGYRLTSEATIAEVQHSAAWLRHQALEMTRRAVEIDRVYHRKQIPDDAQN